MYSPTIENYIKHLHQLERQIGGRVPTGRLAASLGVTHGTATPMVKSLAEAQLVDYESYSGVQLTEAGHRLALSVLRRHRLIELFLVRVLGLDWAEVHEEAEVLEHVVSDRLLERMDEMLGHPTHDPHGDPIPDKRGQLPDQASVPLAEGEPGEYAVVRILGDEPAFLDWVGAHDLRPESLLRLDGHDPMAGTVSIRRGPKQQPLQIGATTAARILVRPVDGTG